MARSAPTPTSAPVHPTPEPDAATARPFSLFERPRVRRGGVLTWLAAITPLVYAVLCTPEAVDTVRGTIALAAAAMFAACWSKRLGAEPRPSLLQVAFAITAFAAVPFPMPGTPTLVLLAVIAVPRFVFVGYARLGATVIVAQSIALAIVYRDSVGGPVSLVAFVGSLGGLMMFAFTAARIVAGEARAVAALAASQSLVATGERLGERVRIARDLHDSVGHHLTALSLHLDLARRQPADDARRTLDTAHAVCRLLLTEVRDVLRDVRRTDADELAAALRDMAARAPGLDVRVDLEADLDGVDSERAHALLRCAQETITNALRHADAQRVVLTLRRDGEQLELVAEDDGRGFAGRRAGGGLDGLEERLLRLGGSLAVTTAVDTMGTRVVASVPVTSEAS